MKPFDLEAAKRGEPIQTRNGRKARFIAHLPECSPPNRVIALVEKEQWSHSFFESGIYRNNEKSPHDLFMEPKKKTVWVNIYRFNEAYHYDSQKEADEAAENCTRIGGRSYPLEIEE